MGRLPRSLGRLASAVAAVAVVGSMFLVTGSSPRAWATPDSAASYAGVDGTATPTSFWLVTSSGFTWGFGDVWNYGGPSVVNAPIVGVTPSHDANGYWDVASDGGIFAFGDAAFYGSMGGTPLTEPVVGMAPTPDGRGYWEVAADGGIFSFGDASFHGSMGATPLAQPVVGMAPTPDGRGYWEVAADGGVFAFGDAGFYGSTGAMTLNRPIVAMAATPDGRGYWLLASDGGVFAFGDAAFAGSMGSAPTPDPAEKIVSDSRGDGYWIVDQNGTAHDFGAATGAPPPQGLLFSAVTPGDAAVLFAFAQLGKPYIWGGNGPVGYDCSGLALASWENGAGISFARVADDQYHTAGVPIALTDLAAGDLVFWGTNTSDWTTVYHTAIYVGGDRIVESTGNQVQLNSLDQWGGSDIMPNGRRP